MRYCSGLSGSLRLYQEHNRGKQPLLLNRLIKLTSSYHTTSHKQYCMLRFTPTYFFFLVVVHVLPHKLGAYEQGHCRQGMLSWAPGSSRSIYLLHRYTHGIIMLFVAKLVWDWFTIRYNVGSELLRPIILIFSYSCSKAVLRAFISKTYDTHTHTL